MLAAREWRLAVACSACPSVNDFVLMQLWDAHMAFISNDALNERFINEPIDPE